MEHLFSNILYNTVIVRLPTVEGATDAFPYVALKDNHDKGPWGCRSVVRSPVATHVYDKCVLTYKNILCTKEKHLHTRIFYTYNIFCIERNVCRVCCVYSV